MNKLKNNINEIEETVFENGKKKYSAKHMMNQQLKY